MQAGSLLIVELVAAQDYELHFGPVGEVRWLVEPVRPFSTRTLRASILQGYRVRRIAPSPGTRRGYSLDNGRARAAAPCRARRRDGGAATVARDARARSGAGLRRDGARSAPRAPASRRERMKATRPTDTARVTDRAPARAKPGPSAGQEAAMHRSHNRSLLLADFLARVPLPAASAARDRSSLHGRDPRSLAGPRR